MLIRRRRALVADDHQIQPVDGGWVTSMRLRGPARPPSRLVLRLHDRAATPEGGTPIDTTATPFLPLVTMLAGVQGLALSVDADVDPVAFDGARRAGALMADWFSWPRHTMTVARRTAAPNHATTPAASGTALFFSRGLDSTHSLFCGRHTIDQLVAVDWEDAPLASDGTRAIMRGTVAAAAELGLPLHRVSSNARQFSDALIGWDDAVGPTLCSFALFLAPLAGTVVVSATLPEYLMHPKGTHPELDPLWSSSRVRIVHEGERLGRTDKAAAVADQPFVHRWLKVCWQRDGDGNCGECAKCLLTMSNFAAAGHLDAVAARFDAPLTADAVLALRSAPVAAENLAEVIDRTAPGPLRDAWSALRDIDGGHP
jgi:hypothetical protein